MVQYYTWPQIQGLRRAYGIACAHERRHKSFERCVGASDCARCTFVYDCGSSSYVVCAQKLKLLPQFTINVEEQARLSGLLRESWREGEGQMDLIYDSTTGQIRCAFADVFRHAYGTRMLPEFA